VKKKSILLISIFILIGLFHFPISAKGSPFPCDLDFFATDKDVYYNDEKIQINATWELDYNPLMEIGFIRVMILNENNTLLWNSTKYSDIGNFTNIWYVDIKSLDLVFENYSYTLCVKFYFYFSQGVIPLDLFLETIENLTIRRNISCELIDFKDYLNFGEVLHFKARFYNTSLNNNSFLTNYIISLKIISNNFVFYKKNYTTNSSGIIEILVPSYSNLTTGLNLIIFTALSNQFFNELVFEFELLIQSPTSKELNSKNPKKIENSLQIELISLISIISLLVVISLLIYYNNTKRRVRYKNLSEITFKY